MEKARKNRRKKLKPTATRKCKTHPLKCLCIFVHPQKLVEAVVIRVVGRLRGTLDLRK